MRKIIIVPDSFKGTMSSRTVGEIMEDEARIFWPEVEIIRMEVADGGEGSVDAFLSILKGKRQRVKVTGPYGEKIDSFYGESGENAVIEMAAAAGLPLAGKRLEAGEATTYGVGELIRAALDRGARKIILGLGGSATNDGGAGALAALGIRFLDKAGEVFVPVGNTLGRIEKIDISGLDTRIRETELLVMCDVDTVLCGEHGASAIFGPQKGASPEDVVRLDRGLKHFAEKTYEAVGVDVRMLAGGGAAGGMGAGVYAFLGGQMERGIDILLEAAEFDRLLEGCSVVMTGEGKIDGQSACGKVVAGVAGKAGKQQVPVIAVGGAVTEEADVLYDMGVSAMFAVNRRALPFEELRKTTEIDLRKTVYNIFRMWKTVEEKEEHFHGKDRETAGISMGMFF